jgi:hypothetical protein
LDVTPIEKFTDIKPDVRNLRVFGSRCWARTATEKLQNRGKLEERARACIFLCYDKGGHAYKVLDERSGEIFTSTNTKFDEIGHQKKLLNESPRSLTEL